MLKSIESQIATHVPGVPSETFSCVVIMKTSELFSCVETFRFKESVRSEFGIRYL
jgi:hypothetical protein